MRLNAANANKSKMLHRTDILVHNPGQQKIAGGGGILKILPEALLKFAVGL